MDGQAGGLAAQSVNVLFQVRFSPSRLHAGVPVALLRAVGPTLGEFAISRRIIMNNVGWPSEPFAAQKPAVAVRIA